MYRVALGRTQEVIQYSACYAVYSFCHALTSVASQPLSNGNRTRERLYWVSTNVRCRINQWLCADLLARSLSAHRFPMRTLLMLQATAHCFFTIGDVMLQPFSWTAASNVSVEVRARNIQWLPVGSRRAKEGEVLAVMILLLEKQSSRPSIRSIGPVLEHHDSMHSLFTFLKWIWLDMEQIAFTVILNVPKSKQGKECKS